MTQQIKPNGGVDNVGSVGTAPSAASAPAKAAPQLVWDDSQMRTSYANVCNVSGSREELALFFGTNQTWSNGQPQVRVQLDNRIVVSPFAAKRLLSLLARVVGEYEKRFGALEIDPARVAASQGQARP